MTNARKFFLVSKTASARDGGTTRRGWRIDSVCLVVGEEGEKNGVRGMWTKLEIRGQRRERAKGFGEPRGVPVPD